MTDLFGDPVKERKTRKRKPPLKAFAASTARAKRHPARVYGAHVETLSGPVSPSAWVWLVGDPNDPSETRRMIRAYRRLKDAGYRHVLQTVTEAKK